MSEKVNKLQFSYSYYKELFLIAPVFLLLITGYLFGLNVYSVFERINTSSFSGIGPFLKDNGVVLFFTVMLVAIATTGMILFLSSGIHLLKESPKDAIMVTGTINNTFVLMFLGITKYNVKKGDRGFPGIVLNGTKYYLPQLGEFEIGDTVSVRVLPKSKLVLEIALSEDRTVTEKEITDIRINKLKFDYDLYFQTNCMGPLFVCIFIGLFFIGCIHGFIRYPEVNTFTPSRVMSLFIPVFLFLLGFLPLRRGGIHLLREKEKDAVIISGTISEVFDLPQIGFTYGRPYPNKGYGMGIVLDGIEYYLPALGEFTVGDRVSAKVLPKSKLVLEMVFAE